MNIICFIAKRQVIKTGFDKRAQNKEHRTQSTEHRAKTAALTEHRIKNKE